MNREELGQLLLQREGPTLDFKREFYNIYSDDKRVKKWQKDELIKDILSLANGNPSVAGEAAFLVIGADNVVPEDTSRMLYDVSGKIPTEQDILQWVNSACAPPLDRVRCDSLTLEGKRLVGITIPPSPHVHEITRQLQTGPSSYYSEYSVFMRQGESIRIASTQDREAMRNRKRDHFTERRNAPPELLGAVVGGVIGAGVAKSAATQFKDNKADQNAYTIAGSLVGVVMGASMGNSYAEGRRLIYELPYMRRREQVAVLSVTFGLAYLARKILHRLTATRT